MPVRAVSYILKHPYVKQHCFALTKIFTLKPRLWAQSSRGKGCAQICALWLQGDTLHSRSCWTGVCFFFSWSEIKGNKIKQIPNQDMVSNSLPGFFVLADINCLGRFITAQALITHSWLCPEQSALLQEVKANSDVKKSKFQRDSHSSAELIS